MIIKRVLLLFAILLGTAQMVKGQSEDLGIAQQPEEKMAWMRDARIGMFIHWGLYAGPAKGEWWMENAGISIDEYRRLAYPHPVINGEQHDDWYFDASEFDADQWMAVAKAMGARYTCMTTEHHDGYALFESHYPTAFTSVQTHNRDFVREYVEAARRAGMRVGLYKTLINWRYPGYYDVSGTDCKANKFGYETAAWHKENARVMKEELYCQTRELMTNYGRIDHLFWDGGWLAQQGTDASGAYFWEPGKWLDPANEWPVNPLWQMKDSLTEKPLGLMGMVRQLQPDLVANLRSGWMGDFTCEEGGHDVKGNIREGVVEKCMTLTPAWGYTSEQPMRIAPLSKIKRICADCMVRGLCFLINVGPDRHGVIPQPVADRAAEFGHWVAQNAPAIYGTRGGPWQPVDGQYGFTYSGNTIYLWLLDGYTASTITLPAVSKGTKARSARILATGEKVRCSQRGQTITITGLPAHEGDITVIAVELNTDNFSNKANASIHQ